LADDDKGPEVMARMKLRDELQKLLVWYSNLPTPPAEFIDVKGTAAVIQFCEIRQSCQIKGVNNMRLELNLREPTLISNYSVRIVQVSIQSALKRRNLKELLAWYSSLPKPLTEVFGIRGMAALAQVCEIIQTCQGSGVDAVHHDMKLQLNYSIRNIEIGIQSATLLQDNNEEAQMEDDTSMEDGTDEDGDDTNIEDGTDEEEMEVDNFPHPTRAKKVYIKFTLAETAKMLQLRKAGKMWQDIALAMPGRTEQSLRLYHSRFTRKQRGKS